MSDSGERADLRTIADYQFGSGAGDALFAGDISVERSSNGRPQQIRFGAERIVSFGLDGRFTLGIEGGRRLRAALPRPQARVVVGDESEPFVRDGKNVFAKFVSDVDAEIRPGDEVIVVHEEDYLLAVGRAELSAQAMLDFEAGMAVKVRDGASET